MSDATFGSGIPTYYANQVRVQRSAADFVMVFARKMPSSIDKDEQEVEIQARVVMSPLMAKLVSNLLSEQVRLHEELTGQKIQDDGKGVVVGRVEE